MFDGMNGYETVICPLRLALETLGKSVFAQRIDSKALFHNISWAVKTKIWGQPPYCCGSNTVTNTTDLQAIGELFSTLRSSMLAGIFPASKQLASTE